MSTSPELTSTLATVGTCKKFAVWLVANNIFTMEDMAALACKEELLPI